MEALVKISVEVAQELLFHCENSSPEYQMLANGIIVDDQLTFRCKTDKAIAFVEWAHTCEPSGVYQIETVNDN